MERKAASGIMLTLLLVSMLALAFNIQQAKASGTIYIRADGSIDPPTANITTTDNVTYVFTGNNYDEIVVQRSNIIIDGDGYTLQGSGSGNGFSLSSMSNVTIKSTNIKGFEHGVYLYLASNNSLLGNNITNNHDGGVLLYSSSNNTVSGNNITNNTAYGVYLFSSSNDNTVSGNPITNNNRGVYLLSSSNNTVSGNNITNNSDGISLFWSSNNIIQENNITDNNDCGFHMQGNTHDQILGSNITNNRIGIRFWGASSNVFRNNKITDNTRANFQFYEDGHFVNDVDASNTVDGKPVYYWVNRRDMTVPLDAGFVALVHCANITVQNLNLTKNEPAILLANTTSSTITKCNITASYGIWLDWFSSNNDIYENNLKYGDIRLAGSSSKNSIHGNNISAHARSGRGVSLLSSSDNSIYENYVTDTYQGILLVGSSNNSIWENHVAGSTYGIRLEQSLNNSLFDNTVMNNGNGINLYNNNTLYNNNVTNNEYGISIGSSCSIYGNDVTNNYCGIEFSWSSKNNTLYDNNLMNNTFAIQCDRSQNNNIHSNNITNNQGGILLSESSNKNNIYGNNMTGNGHGIWLGSSNHNSIYENNIATSIRYGAGVALTLSSSNTIYGNNITGGEYGVYLSQSYNNTVSGNNITNNDFSGVRSYLSSNNTFYHNNFIDNPWQVCIETPGYTNFWDNGYPSGGNYWSDYTGVDVKSGPNQDQLGSDGIGDTPYVIDEDNQDNYPLMYPWGAPPPPSYILTIYSSPTGVTFTVDGVPRKTPWSGNYIEGTSVGLVMPEIYTVGDARYYWNQWSDGNTSRSRTVTMNTDIALTAHYAGPYYQFTVTVDGLEFNVVVDSNSTVSDFDFRKGQKEISFSVTGPDGTAGFCNVTIPMDLMTGEPWLIRIDGVEVTNYIQSNNGTHTFLYFTYTHTTHNIKIRGTWVVPEFPTWTSMLLILILLAVAIAIYKRRLLKTPIH